jgi:hypothetical protein
MVARIKGYEIVFTPPSKNRELYPNCGEGRYLRGKCFERPLKVRKSDRVRIERGREGRGYNKGEDMERLEKEKRERKGEEASAYD